MQATFHLHREQENVLEYGSVKNPNRGLHFHSQIEVYLILEGEVEVWVNDRCRVLSSGEMSVAFSYDAHGYRTIGASKVAYLIVPTDLLGEFLPLFTGKRAGDPFVSDKETFERVRGALEAIMGGANELAVRGYIYVILGSLLDRMSLEEEGALRDPRFSARILLYVSAHYREELTLTSLAEALGYNPSYLSRSFRETFGIGFSEYVTMLRLREAILLLRAGTRSITACAMESGFQSLRSFYRAFYREFKCTPREYLAAERKEHR